WTARLQRPQQADHLFVAYGDAGERVHRRELATAVAGERLDLFNVVVRDDDRAHRNCSGRMCSSTTASRGSPVRASTWSGSAMVSSNISRSRHSARPPAKPAKSASTNSNIFFGRAGLYGIDGAWTTLRFVIPAWFMSFRMRALCTRVRYDW